MTKQEMAIRLRQLAWLLENKPEDINTDGTVADSLLSLHRISREALKESA